MHGQPQYTMVTKQRKKAGCGSFLFHAFMTVITAGLWLVVGPPAQWLWHRTGPKQKAITTVYGPGQQPAYPPQPGYGHPPMTADQLQWEQWRQLPGTPAANPYATPPQLGYPAYQERPPYSQQPPAATEAATYQTGQPPSAPEDPDDPWNRPQTRRRS